MYKSRIFKICIIIFLFFVVMAIIEIITRGISSEISNIVINIEEEKKNEEFYNSEKEVNKRNIKEFVNNILDALNDKDYDYVTYYLDDTYLKYFFDNDKEKTKETLKNYLEDGAKYQITDISDAGDKYYVSIGYTKDEIFRTKYITLYDLENGVYKIMLGHYNYISPSDYSTKSNNIIFDNTYTYAVGNKRVYPIDICNNSNEDVVIEFEDAYLLGITGNQKHCMNIENVTLKTGENQKIELIVENIVEDIISLNLKVKINGIEKDIQMYSEKGSRA